MSLKQQFAQDIPVKLMHCTGPVCLAVNPKGRWKGTISFVASQGRNRFKLMTYYSECRAALKKSVARV